VQRPQRQRSRYRLLSIVISGLLLIVGAIVTVNKIDWREFTAIWMRLDARWLLVALLVYWLQYPLNSVRLHCVMRWLHQRAPENLPKLSFIFRITCASGFVAAAAPFGLVGDLAKIAALRFFGTLSSLDATRITLFDRVLGTQWMSLIGLAALPIQYAVGVGTEMIAVQALVFGSLIGALGALLTVRRVSSLPLLPLFAKVAPLFAGYGSLLAPRRSLVQFIIAFLNVATAWGTLCLLYRAFDLSPNLGLVALFIPFLQLINGVPLLYMGWGGREIAMVATLGAVSGFSASETLFVSSAWGIVLIIAGAVNGVFLLGVWDSSRSAR
jgi:hypothetical protein